MVDVPPSPAGGLPSSLDLSVVREIVGAIPDPEIPVITIEELGILRGVDRQGERIVVTITPTYSGCPAMEMIRGQILEVLTARGVDDVQVRTVYSPAWTTEWLSEDAKHKLVAFGIAPPGQADTVVCPRCRSDRVSTVSFFGSTACKALMVCDTCSEPFDWFKNL